MIKKPGLPLFFASVLALSLSRAQDEPVEAPEPEARPVSEEAAQNPAEVTEEEDAAASEEAGQGPAEEEQDEPTEPVSDEAVDPTESPVQAPVDETEPEAPEDRLLADFEGEDYGEWTVDGNAFGSGPASGPVDGQMEVSGFEGQGLANSFHGGDASMGRLTSPSFAIERKYFNLLVGGGKHDDTVVRLLIDGQTAREARGSESEELRWQTWHVEPLQGQTAVIEIVDGETGGWGHILADQLYQSDTAKTAPLVNVAKRLPITERYLNLPVETGAPKTRMSLSVDGNVIREFDIELSESPDFWVFTDLADYQGKDLTITARDVPQDADLLDAVVNESEIKDTHSIYGETHRPQFHFSARRGWLNDPNGLVYYKGEYHLFFQHNPYGYNWGNMHWGHAVSPDLVHWRELPIALYPKAYGDWAFSGGAVVDSENTAGFKTGDEDVLVAFYTSTGRGECVVYSNDAGRTWTEFEGNPVVTHQGRDPKVIWHGPSKQWVMAVYTEGGSEQAIAFHTSPDLKNWTEQSKIAGFFECPEIFPLEVDLDPSRVKWILYGADGAYMIGEFDGKEFTPNDSEKLPGNFGNCFYASQTFSNVPSFDGRRIQIGWGRIEMPEMPFNQMMLFPCTLRLHETEEGLRMFTYPVKEIYNLHDQKVDAENETIGADGKALPELTGGLYDIDATFVPGEASSIGFDIDGTRVIYNAGEKTLTCLDKSAPLEPNARGEIRLRLLVDRASIEIFANHGLVYMPMGVIPKEDAEKGVRIVSEGGDTELKSLRAATVRSIWPGR